MPKLVFTEGVFAGQEMELPDAALIIGRGEEANLVIEDGEISGQHAELLPARHPQAADGVEPVTEALAAPQGPQQAHRREHQQRPRRPGRLARRVVHDDHLPHRRQIIQYEWQRGFFVQGRDNDCDGLKRIGLHRLPPPALLRSA